MREFGVWGGFTVPGHFGFGLGVHGLRFGGITERRNHAAATTLLFNLEEQALRSLSGAGLHIGVSKIRATLGDPNRGLQHTWVYIGAHYVWKPHVKTLYKNLQVQHWSLSMNMQMKASREQSPMTAHCFPLPLPLPRQMMLTMVTLKMVTVARMAPTKTSNCSRNGSSCVHLSFLLRGGSQKI